MACFMVQEKKYRVVPRCLLNHYWANLLNGESRSLMDRLKCPW